jgi:hypothetical protein
MAILDDILKYLRDLDRQVSALQRLDVNPPVSSATTYSGTPAAGQLAVWSGAGTVFGTATYGTATIATLAGTQTLTNKTLDSTNIASLTAKNPPVDADSAVIVDSAATNFFKAVTYTNIKAFLKTYFDTLYLAYATTSGVTLATLGNLTIADISPGSITTAQTWTIDITVTLNAARVSGIFDILIECTSSASATQRIFYRASISFVRNALGDTAVIESIHEMDNRNTLTTFAGPTAIANGIRFTVQPTTNTFNRTHASIIGSGGSSPALVTSAVA